jgi:hypothetical protein
MREGEREGGREHLGDGGEAGARLLLLLLLHSVAVGHAYLLASSHLLLPVHFHIVQLGQNAREPRTLLLV